MWNGILHMHASFLLPRFEDVPFRLIFASLIRLRAGGLLFTELFFHVFMDSLFSVWFLVSGLSLNALLSIPQG